MIFNIKLSPSEIEKAIGEVEEYKKKLDSDVEKALDILLDEAYEIAKRNIIGEQAFYTGELMESLSKEKAKNVRVLFTELPYAKFVEYGTGIRGAEEPHPQPPAGWIYDRNKHGEEGWWYPTNDPSLIRYTAPDGKTYGWTKGIPHRPFMYDTARELDKIKYDIVKEVMGK